MDLLNKLEAQLLEEGYAMNPRPIPPDIGALGWAWRKGRLADDFVFLFEGLEVEGYKRAYGLARKWANRQFKLPKAMRLRVPHCVCLLVTDHVDGRLKAFVDKTASRSVWGGEVNHLLVVDRKQGRVHHQPVSGAVGHNELVIYDHIGFAERVLALL